MDGFSVLMSLYHKEKPAYLDAALSSVLQNTVPPSQVVLVLDGPVGKELTDVVEKYVSRFKTLELFPLEKNGGLGAALNYGLRKCRYDIVFRMDTDDICYPDRFEKILTEYEKDPGLEIVGSSVSLIDDEGKVWLDLYRRPETEEGIYKAVWRNPFIHPSVSYRKSSILKVGSYNPDFFQRQEDYELWFRCVEARLHCKNLGDPLLYFRVTEDSIYRNSIRVGWERAKVGLAGSIRCKCPAIAYLGVFYPFVRALMPHSVQRWLYRMRFKKSHNDGGNIQTR